MLNYKEYNQERERLMLVDISGTTVKYTFGTQGQIVIYEVNGFDSNKHHDQFHSNLQTLLHFNASHEEKVSRYREIMARIHAVHNARIPEWKRISEGINEYRNFLKDQKLYNKELAAVLGIEEPHIERTDIGDNGRVVTDSAPIIPHSVVRDQLNFVLSQVDAIVTAADRTPRKKKKNK